MLLELERDDTAAVEVWMEIVSFSSREKSAVSVVMILNSSTCFPIFISPAISWFLSCFYDISAKKRFFISFFIDFSFVFAALRYWHCVFRFSSFWMKTIVKKLRESLILRPFWPLKWKKKWKSYDGSYKEQSKYFCSKLYFSLISFYCFFFYFVIHRTEMLSLHALKLLRDF